MRLPSIQNYRMLMFASCGLAAVACRSDKTIGIRHEAPAVQIVEPADSSTFYAFDPVLFTAQVEVFGSDSVTDIEHQWVAGDSVVCDWDIVPSDGFATCPIVFSDDGSFSVTVTVKDARLDTATSTVSVEIIANQAPVITITTPEDGRFASPDEVIEFTATVSDAEDASEDLRISGVSDLDGDLGLDSIPATSGDWAANIGDLSSGTHLITLTVVDSVGQSGLDSVTVAIDGKPTAPEVSIIPDPAASGESLTAQIDVESVDPEDQPVSYDYLWLRDGTPYTTDSVSAVIPSGVTQRDEYWELVVTPRDPHGEGTPGTASITIGNSPPRVDTVNIDPFNPTTSDPLTAVPSGWADQDGDPELYAYEWELNGEMDTDETTATFPAAKTQRDDNLRVTLTPMDGFSSGGSVSSSLVTIQNTPPTSGTVTIIPEDPEPNEELFCDITEFATDVDDDAITYIYTWYVDGVEYPAYTTGVIPWGETENGETWMCEVTADDGTVSGEPFSEVIYISDGTRPDPPTFNATSSFRNQDTLDLTGSCEAGCSLWFECEDATRTWEVAGECSSEGIFSITVEPLVRGISTECWGTCTDGAGNESDPSDTISTTVCDPEDEFENGSYGDEMDDPIDEWGSIDDTSESETIEITGNLLDDDDSDWYVVTALDDVAADIAAGLDTFHFAAEFTEGMGTFNFVIYRDDPDSGSDSHSCMPDPDGYTEYDWYIQDVGDGTHTPPAILESCGDASSEINICEDNTSDFYIHVQRNPSVEPSCEPYRISVTNGDE